MKPSVIGLLGLLVHAVVSLSAGPASAAPSTLRWAADAEGGAPYVFRDPRNPSRMIGFEVDLMEEVAKRLGLRAEFVQNQWDSLIPGLQRGDYDVAVNGIEITEDRKREVRFSDPYFVTYEQLTVRKETQDIQSLDDAKGRIAGTLKYSLAERMLKAHGGIEVRGYDSQTTIYEDLSNGRLDFVLLDHPVAVYYGNPDPGLKSVGRPIGDMSYGIAVPLQNAELQQKINQVLASMKREGKLREIYDRWGIWNSRMADAFQDHSPSKPATELNEYLAAMGKTQTWQQQAAQYWSYVPLLARGAVTTLQLSAVGMLLAVAIGLVLALVRLYVGGFPGFIALAYTEAIRGTPLLIQLFFIFYGLPNIGIKLSPFVAAVIGLGMNYGAYEAEVYRAGFLSVPRSQLDAALSLGMNRWQALCHVILPQATRVALPPMTNDFISLLKDSSLVSVITMVELTKVYGQLASTYYDYLGIGILTAAMYFVIGLPFVRLSRALEKKFTRGRPHV
jgi:polar amino acid transport system substrate-binding protein